MTTAAPMVNLHNPSKETYLYVLVNPASQWPTWVSPALSCSRDSKWVVRASQSDDGSMTACIKLLGPTNRTRPALSNDPSWLWEATPHKTPKIRLCLMQAILVLNYYRCCTVVGYGGLVHSPFLGPAVLPLFLCVCVSLVSTSIMGLDDHGIGKDSVLPLSKFVTIIVFNSIALWNVVELSFIIFATFKRRRGLYFWSFLVASWGIIPHCLGFIFKYQQLTTSWVFVTLFLVGWWCMVTGQSFVLYSRLHLIMLSPFRLKLVKTMIIVDAVICHVPISVMAYGVNSPNPAPFIPVYTVYEKIQLSIFFIQEIIISGLYIYETVKLMQIRKGVQGNGTRSSRHLMSHLIVVNVIIVVLDITVLGLEYSGMYDLQTSYKPFVYSVKLKLEFSILNKLVELTTRGGSKRSSTYTPSRGDANPQMDMMYDGVHRGKAVDLGNNVYVRSETASGEEVKAGGQAVVLTTEVSVRRNTMPVEHDSDGDLGNLNIETRAGMLGSPGSSSERNVAEASC